MKGIKAGRFQVIGALTTVAGALLTLVNTWAEHNRSDEAMRERVNESVKEALRERGL